MFPSRYFTKLFWTGLFWPPAEGAIIVTTGVTITVGSESRTERVVPRPVISSGEDRVILVVGTSREEIVQ